MIIDVHYHYTPFTTDIELLKKIIPSGFLPKDTPDISSALDMFLMTQATHQLTNAARAGVSKSLNETLSVYKDIFFDIECDKLIKRMDKCGIDVSVINVVDNFSKEPDNERALNLNELCARAAAKHPGRLIAMASIDPRRPNAPELLRKCIVDFNMKGLKWHPDHGYYPNSDQAYAVLEVANEYGIPLLTHSGPLPTTQAKFSQPIYLDDVAFTFPQLNIIAAHMGDIWWHEWAAIARYKDNVYGDLAMWQMMSVGKPWLFRRYLREIVDIVGPNKVIFGTDAPVFEPIISNQRMIDDIKNLTKVNADGIIFSEEEVSAILGGNAARIFKL